MKLPKNDNYHALISLTNFELLQHELKESKVIGNLEIAKWITPRNPLSTALLVTLHQFLHTECIDALGEQARSKVLKIKI